MEMSQLSILLRHGVEKFDLMPLCFYVCITLFRKSDKAIYDASFAWNFMCTNRMVKKPCVCALDMNLQAHQSKASSRGTNQNIEEISRVLGT